ncbi:MAG TPA: CinA family protein, partial [bacterium]|nr:CinA family protein [bacterium]
IPTYLLDYGEVSLEVAESLARMAKEKFSSDIGIGITGNAGPSQGDISKPVGYVCISVVNNGSAISRDFQLEGDRERIRFLAVQWSLDMLRRSI